MVHKCDRQTDHITVTFVTLFIYLSIRERGKKGDGKRREGKKEEERGREGRGKKGIGENG